MENVFQDFGVYKKAVAVLQEDMLQLENFCEELGLDATKEGVRAVRERTAEDSFKVAVVGEFKRGKSTLINALLGKEILPADPLPCSATLNRITYDVKPHALISFKDGTNTEVPVEELRNYVTKLTEESAQTAETIKEATVFYPLNYCKNNVDIIDTPGLNDDENMTQVTLSVIPQVDISIMAIMALSPFGQYEKDFLENKLMASDVGKVVFVVTRIDLVDEEDRERIVSHVREEITKHILVKAKKLYGEDSEEYQEYVRKIGDVKIIGISPRNALRGKLRDDKELYEESNYPEFEKELERMLLEERGAIQLREQLSKVLAAVTEIAQNGELQKNAMQMDSGEFEEKYRVAKEQFAEIREKREAEKTKIRLAGQNLSLGINGMTDEYWKELLGEIYAAIDQFPMSEDDVKKENMENTQSRLWAEIQTVSRNSMQIFNERVQNAITDAVGRETERLESFEADFFQSMAGVAQEFTPDQEDDKVNGMFSAVGALVSVLAAGNVIGGTAGSIYEGYKRAGLKGALVGGGASLGGIFATNLLVNSILVASGVSLGVLALPLYAAMGIVGAFTGKFALNKFLGGGSQKQIDNLRQAFKDQINNAILEQKREGTLKEEYRKQIEEIFRKISDKVDQETESIMSDMEHTLENLQKQKLESQVIDETGKNRLNEILSKTTEISKRAVELRQQLMK